MSPELRKNLSVVCAEIEKFYGKGSVMRLTDEVKIEPDDVISTGSIGLDCALGIGGYKKGRIIEIYGPESCIAGESYLQYEVWANGKRINHKGGNIRRLYERFNKEITEEEPKQGRHLQNNNSTFYIKSVNHENMIVRNEILAVVKTGKKLCFRLETETGEVIFSTAEHKYMTPNGFMPLSDLKEGDTVFVHNNSRVEGKKYSSNRPEVYVKYHPNFPAKIVHDNKTGKDYLYHRGQKARIAYEAFLNEKTYEEYIEILNTFSRDYIKNNLRFLPENIHVHHIDENFNNNEISNLQLLDPSEHGRLHAEDRIKNLSFIAIPSKIISIKEAEEMDTYDIKCTYPYNNYIAEGIVVHNSGKSTLCLHAVESAQKQGKTCVYIDAEQSFDKLYAANLGVDISELLLVQPDNGEQALEIANMFVKSGEIGLIIIDSVAALIPQKELEGEIGDASVGTQARLMSQAMRMLVGPCNKTGTTIIFTNQIRMKIGVMFGCFHYDARILLADGTTEKIGKIVNQKLPVEVLSADNTGKISAKKIIDWHDNGKANKFIQVVIEYPHGNGRSNLPVGDDHILITPTGEKKVSELSIGDEVFIRSTNYLTKQQMEYAIGTFLGDASLRINDANNTARLRLTHGKEQNDYCKYKSHLFPAEFTGSQGTSDGKFFWESVNSPQLASLSKYKEGGAIRFLDRDLIEKITLRSIALWYLDDGTFGGSFSRWGWGKSTIYATKMDEVSKKLVADKFVDLGLPRPSLVEKGFMFSGKNNKIFHEKIARYVPFCMRYKIHPAFKPQLITEQEQNPQGEIYDVLIPARIVDIYEKTMDKSTHKFDITIEGNHSYFVDNVLVHNSPETTSGGNALKFYASQRIDLRRTGDKKVKEEIIGVCTKAKVVKNKVAPPKRDAEFDIIYGKGIDRDSELLGLAIGDQIIEKAGAWFKYKGESIAQGEASAIEWLKSNQAIKEEIFKQVMELRGLA